MPLAPAITVSAASSTSAKPGRGRLRSAANAVAARVAAIRSSGEGDMPRSRSKRAAPTNHRLIPGSPGWRNTCAYQPGLRTPAPYPVAAARRRWVHGTQHMPTFTRGRPRSVWASVVADGSGSASAGTCHAPQTTAIRSCPSAIALRSTWRMCASRCASRRVDASRPPRTAVIAIATASNAGAPSPRCSITSSHHRSGSGSPAASASAASGSPMAIASCGSSSANSASASPCPASDCCMGRSMARTTTSC